MAEAWRAHDCHSDAFREAAQLGPTFTEDARSGCCLCSDAPSPTPGRPGPRAATLPVMMSIEVAQPASLLRPLPIGPSEQVWHAMTPAERERWLVTVFDALSDPHRVMSEGRPHKKAKTRAVDMLGLHFKALGRVVYLAEEMAVVYPGVEAFSPDVLAVVGVPQPEDDPRMAWVKADEGRGLDFVLEVLHHGNRSKDLVENVEKYARLGIPEYFIYDRLRQQLHGYRLAAPDAPRYQRVVPQSGRYGSNVLGLELAIQGDTLRFFQGMAELFGSTDLIGRLTGMVEDLEAKAEQATTRAEQAAFRAEDALAGVREGILALLDARGIACPDEARGDVMSCDDPPTLRRWLSRAKTAGTAAEILVVESRTEPAQAPPEP
jgi:Uma2 family endonuclease